MRFLMLTCFLLVSTFSYSQKNGLINSGDLIRQSDELYNQGKYKETIAVLQQVPRSDTNYSKVLRDLALTYFADSNFQASKEAALLGLELFPGNKNEWYNLQANALSNLGQKTEALGLYQKIIDSDRNNFLAYFNKGIVLYQSDKFDEATIAFQQCVLINPYYSSAHYFLGQICLKQGKLPEAMLSYSANLLINPTNKYHQNSIRGLSAIAKVTDEVKGFVANRKNPAEDNFSTIQEIIVNALALDKEYELKASLEDPIVRQLQVLVEKLEYAPNDKNFWMQYYVPFFAAVFAEEKFEPLVFQMFSALDVKPIVSYVKKNDKEIGQLRSIAADYFNEIKLTRELHPADRKSLKKRFYYSDNELFGIGQTELLGKETILTGPWVFYYPNGTLKSKGAFNNSQEKTGTWEFYHDNGQLKEKTTYVNGMPDGKIVTWFSNGLKASEGMYTKGELNGAYKEYYYNGVLKKTAVYRDDKKEGVVKGYNIAGILRYVQMFKNDKEEGETINYYNNGQVENKCVYKEGEANGRYLEYYYGGELKMEGTYLNNKRTGVWKEYHLTGKVSSETNYVDDEPDGEEKQFYENGQLASITPYVKAKINGFQRIYDEDGKMSSEVYFERDRLKDIKFFDKSGKVISSATSRNGSGNITFYDTKGNKLSEGYYNKEGLLTGQSTRFYTNGTPSMIAEYADGFLNGTKTSYYINGVISGQGKYTANVEDGYFIEYHLSGKKKQEGWIVEGSKQGAFIMYNESGDIERKINYLENEQHGYTEHYYPNGRLFFEEKFENGWLESLRQYDTSGKPMAKQEFVQGKGAFEWKFANGKPFTRGSYLNNFLHGEHRIFYPDGSTYSVQYYKAGYPDSVHKTFYLGGQLAFEGGYRFGNRHGEWKFYHENGKLHSTEQYVNGLEQKKMLMYNDDGTLDKEGEYRNGLLHGAYRMYGDNNNLAVQINYKDGTPVSYTYEDKTGKLIEPIAIRNGTVDMIGYYKNGTKSIELQLLEGEVHGTRKIFFTNGKPYIDGSRVAGQENGSKKIYYPDGRLEKEENYIYDNLHGKVMQYYPDGKTRSVEYYHNGVLHGECRYYSNSGKLQVRTYFYGQMQSVK